MIWFLFIISMGIVGRLAGRGAWRVNVPAGHFVAGGFEIKTPEFSIDTPEWIYTSVFGLALGWATGSFWLFLLGWLVSYAGMQSGTWSFLRWESHDDPNTERDGTMKGVVDWIAGKFGFKLGDEGYAWIAASVKGFIISLPVGGLLGAVLWPLGYEIGSHAKGRVEKYGIDPHAFSEFFSCALGAVGVLVFAWVVGILVG